MVTLTKEEYCDIKCKVEDIFLEVEDVFTRMNAVGYKGDMHEGNELLVYAYLLRDINLAEDFQDDTYVSILSNKDIYRIFNRALEIESHIKRQVL